MPIIIGALREAAPRETRVSLVPEVAEKFIRAGVRILLERGAGERANFPDSAYRGVEWSDAAGVLGQADVLLTVQPLVAAQIGALKAGAVLVGFLQPHARREEILALQRAGATSFAMELVPRISRAQSMDFLACYLAAQGGQRTVEITDWNANRRCAFQKLGPAV